MSNYILKVGFVVEFGFKNLFKSVKVFVVQLYIS